MSTTSTCPLNDKLMIGRCRLDLDVLIDTAAHKELDLNPSILFAALAGCGVPASLAALVAAAEDGVRRAEPTAVERGRLAAAAAARILARAPACGLHTALQENDMPILIARLWQVAASDMPGRIDTARDDLVTPLGSHMR